MDQRTEINPILSNDIHDLCEYRKKGAEKNCREKKAGGKKVK